MSLLNPASALLAGVVTSMHCMGMCGPLACAMIGGGGKQAASKAVSFGGYHFARLLSYALVGALAGGAGGSVLEMSGGLPSTALPIAFAVFFLLMALGMDRFFLKLPFVGNASRRIVQRAYRVQNWKRGIVLGLSTPLIPCGPLYLAFWIAAISGSAASGAFMLLSFGLGTVPGLLATQVGWSYLSTRASPERLARWRRNLAIIASVILIARSFISLDAESVLSGDSICL